MQSPPKTFRSSTRRLQVAGTSQCGVSISVPLPATAADVPATRIYLLEIAADSQEIGTDTAAIAAYIAEIGTYMKEIAGCSLETRIAFMEPTPDWSEIATYTPETGNYRKEMAGNVLETAGSNRGKADNRHKINGLRAFPRFLAVLSPKTDIKPRMNTDGHG